MIEETRHMIVSFLNDIGVYNLPHRRQIVVNSYMVNGCLSNIFLGNTLELQIVLGDHLLSTHDLLLNVGADRTTCVAGALHSIYGTNKYKFSTFSCDATNRKYVSDYFGEEIERLAFLFHSCNRPYDLNKGLLAIRFEKFANDECYSTNSDDKQLMRATTKQLQSLRLIEAANFIDQGGMSDLILKWPAILKTWQQQSLTYELIKAVQPYRTTSSMPSNQMTSINSWIPSTAQKVRIKIMNIQITPFNIYSINQNVEIPIIQSNKATINIKFLYKKLINFSKSFAKALNINMNSINFGYCLHREDRYGMPWCPLWLLNNFLKSHCSVPKTSSRLLIDIKIMNASQPVKATLPHRLVRSKPESINVDFFFPSKSTSSVLTQDSVMNRMLSDLKRFGFAIVRVHPSHVTIIQQAYQALQDFHLQIPIATRRKLMKRFDCHRYLGWAKDNCREWIQLRTFQGDVPSHAHWLITTTLGIMDESNPIFEIFERMLRATELLERMSVSIFRGLCPGLGIPIDEKLMDDQHPNYWFKDWSNEPFGSSVHRLFKYLDVSAEGRDPSEIVMASTRPALNLIHHETFEIICPENDLQPNEWLLFAGGNDTEVGCKVNKFNPSTLLETLSYLTNGEIPAPLHQVPSKVNDSQNEEKEVHDHDQKMESPQESIDERNRTADYDTLHKFELRIMDERSAMPFFLRIAPEMPLLADKADSQSHEILATRMFLNQHLFVRPYRLGQNGDF